MRSHSMANLLFLNKKKLFLEKTWSRHLFLFYFLKEKQNKKENPKCDSLFEKDSPWKIETSPRVKLLIGKVW